MSKRNKHLKREKVNGSCKNAMTYFSKVSNVLRNVKLHINLETIKGNKNPLEKKKKSCSRKCIILIRI